MPEIILDEKAYYSAMMLGLLPLSSSGTMNAAAPDGASCAADR
jgi:hypothetical protein